MHTSGKKTWLLIFSYAKLDFDFDFEKKSLWWGLVMKTGLGFPLLVNGLKRKKVLFLFCVKWGLTVSYFGATTLHIITCVSSIWRSSRTTSWFPNFIKPQKNIIFYHSYFLTFNRHRHTKTSWVSPSLRHLQMSEQIIWHQNPGKELANLWASKWAVK